MSIIANKLLDVTFVVRLCQKIGVLQVFPIVKNSPFFLWKGNNLFNKSFCYSVRDFEFNQHSLSSMYQTIKNSNYLVPFKCVLSYKLKSTLNHNVIIKNFQNIENMHQIKKLNEFWKT